MTIDQSALLDDRYRLDARIGTGGMADVFRGTDQVLDRQVAVKVLREVHDPTQRARFVDEARTLAGLDHPGLITLLDAGIQGERPYLVLTLADGATLSSRIAEGPLAPADVADLGIQVAQALAYAHERGIVHRDVKPSNVLLCADGRALLADFGIARLVGSTDHHTRTGDAIGSPAYLAPEQVVGEDLTPALDIYSFGLVLLEALTALRAFPGTPVEAAVARLNAAPPMPTSLSPAWRDLLARMTHRLPENRPSAAEVAAELAGLAVATDTAPQDGAEHTAVLSALEVAEATGAVTMESPFHSAGPVEQKATYRVVTLARRRWVQVLAAALALLAVVVVVLLVRGGGDTPTNEAPAVPDNVPSRFSQPLADLHDAVNGPAR